MSTRPPLQHELGLKAIAWDFDHGTFVSPSATMFKWSKDGLESADCASCKEKGEQVPGEECSCGMYSTFRWMTASCYQGTSVISPILLFEVSGRTHIYMEGMRSFQLVPRFVIYEDYSHIAKVASYQAAEYFDVPVVTKKIGLMIMDIWNITLNEDWRDWYLPENANIKRASQETINQWGRALLGGDYAQNISKGKD